VDYQSKCQLITRNSSLWSWLGPITFPYSFAVPFFLFCSRSYSAPSPPARYHSSSACPPPPAQRQGLSCAFISLPRPLILSSAKFGRRVSQPSPATAANNVRRGSNLAWCLPLSHHVGRDPNVARRYYGRCF
jgi:hypothetical protein